MPLSLVTAVGSNFLKDFPSQNAVNCDAIDAFAGPCLTSDSLQSYTPILTAVTTNPTLGTAGFIRGFYYQIWDQIWTWGEFRFGTASINAGSGIYMVTLPFEANTLLGASVSLGAAPVVGNGLVWDNDAAGGRRPITSNLRTSTQLMFGVPMDLGLANREVQHNSPITWAINDGIIWSAKYQRVP